jgi:alkylation response protein AidB-like acyl-CoA dehydrogenase
MSFALTPSQIDLRVRHTELGRQLAELLQRLDGPLPADAWRWCGERGLLGPIVSRDLGGGGQSALDTVLAMEGLGAGCPDLGFLIAVNAHLWGTVLPLATLGSDGQRAAWLPPLLAGELVGAHCITESEAGSDVHGMATTIAVDGDGLRIDGHKQFITGASRAGLFLVYGRDPAAGDAALSAVLLPADTPGLEVIDQPKLGLTGAPMGEVRLDGCRAGRDQLLGRAGAGMAQFATALEWERSCIFAPVLGAMQRQLDRAVKRARGRRQFGQPIGRFQSVANRIVDMRMRLDVGRLLLYQVASLKNDGGRAPLESSQAKLHISEAFVRSSLDAMQIHGGTGYLADSEEARDLRDAPAGTLFSGTSEIQRVIIARFLGL